MSEAGNGMSVVLSLAAAEELTAKMKQAEDLLAGLEPIDANNLPTEAKLIKRFIIDSGPSK